MEFQNFTDLIEHIKTNINLKDFATKHYGFEFAADRGQKNIMANCRLKSHGKTDNTPSFAYKPATNSYQCYACHDSGSIIDFVANMEGLETSGEDFGEIIRIICEKENIPFDTKEKKVDKKVMLELERRTDLATQYLLNLWKNKSGEAFQYLLYRGLTEQTIKDFALGLTSHNESRFGLSGISNRISFPIRSDNGKYVTAFSYRTLNRDDKCKYINNPEDEIFHKRQTLYGWAHAVKTIRETKTIYIVEGQMDMISLYQIGIKNAVATMTNIITDEQIAFIAKYAKKIIYIIDQDKAGENGFVSRLDSMLAAGLDVKVVNSLDYLGKDINEVCIKINWDYNTLINILNRNAVDGVFFKMNKLLNYYDQKMLDLQSSILSVFYNTLSSIPDEAKKATLKSYVANRLKINQI